MIEAAGHFPDPTKYERRRRGQLNKVFALVFTVCGIIFVALHNYATSPLLGYLLLAGISLVGSLMFFKKKDRANDLVANTLIGTILFCIAMVQFFLNGPIESNLSWILVIPFVAVYLVGFKAGLYWIIITFALQGIFFSLELIGYKFPDLRAPLHIKLGVHVSYLISFITISFFALLFEWNRTHDLARLFKTQTELRDVKNQLDRKVRQRTQDLVSAQERAEALYHKAVTANRIKDEFLAKVSHELRTPLMLIIGWIEMLRDRSVDESEVTHVIETIRNSAEQEMSLVSDLLDISRIISGTFHLEKKNIDLISVIQEAIDSFQLTAKEKAIHISLQNNTTNSQVFADASRMQQIFANLLSNAIKFSNHGGIITVYVANVESWVRVTVEDNGAGMPPEIIPFVFDSFFQQKTSSDNLTTGLGVGLTITKELVERHGGNIQAFSEGPGKGARFVVEFPTTAVRMSAKGEAKCSSPDITNAIKTPLSKSCLEGVEVLLIDDDMSILGLVQAMLKSYGAKIVTASSAEEGFKRLSHQHFDAILCDINMPVEDGYSFVHRLRKLSPEQGGSTPTAALTAYAFDHDKVKAYNAGFNLHVAKPVVTNDLITKVLKLKRLQPFTRNLDRQ